MTDFNTLRQQLVTLANEQYDQGIAEAAGDVELLDAVHETWKAEMEAISAATTTEELVHIMETAS